MTTGPTYAFWFSDDHGRNFRQVATGQGEGDMTTHMQRVFDASKGPHLRVTAPDGGHQLHSQGGPNDGWVWSWRVER